MITWYVMYSFGISVNAVVKILSGPHPFYSKKLFIGICSTFHAVDLIVEEKVGPTVRPGYFIHVRNGYQRTPPNWPNCKERLRITLRDISKVSRLPKIHQID